MRIPYINVGLTSKNIRKIRKEKGVSVKEIQELLGLSRGAVYKWEDGSRLPSIDNLVALAYILGVDIDDLLICNFY